MNYFLQELQIDLQDTSIENIFITDYMPFADGTYVKVYILGYKYATDKEDSNFNNETIAKNLKIPLSDVLNAWSFWESQGIIKKHIAEDEYNYSIEFINLKQLYIDKIYKHLPATSENSDSVYVTNTKLVESNKDNEFKKMQDEIDKIFGEPQTISNKRKIVQWQREYKLSPEMIIQAFSYCVNNKKIRRYSYIESIIKLWKDENIDNIDALSDFLEKKEDRFFIYSRISKALGFNNRALTEGERRTIDKWVEDFGYSIDMILKGLENSTKISSPNINYFDAIFEKWHEKGYKNPEDVVNDKKPNVKKEATKQYQAIPQTKNKFHNFEQKTSEYTPEELKEYGKRNLEKKLKELGLDITNGGDN